MAPVRLNGKLEGNGPGVVLLHPVGVDLTCWDGVAARLAGSHLVLRVDLAGHGQSPAAPAGYMLEDYADDVHAAMAAHGFAPAAIVGLSFGGMIAQTLAIRHPGDVSHLVVSGCPCTLPPAARDMMVERAAQAERNGMGSVIEETLQRWFTPDFIASGGAEPTRQRLLADDPAGWASGWRAISQLDTQPRLGEIRVPALCIAGERDPAAPPAALETVARGIQGARLLVLPGAPHMMQIEQPEAYAKAVAGLIADNPPPA